MYIHGPYLVWELDKSCKLKGTKVLSIELWLSMFHIWQFSINLLLVFTVFQDHDFLATEDEEALDRTIRTLVRQNRDCDRRIEELTQEIKNLKQQIEVAKAEVAPQR